MSRAQEHLAQANGHIAELKVQIVRQRVIVKYALDTGQRSERRSRWLMRSKEAFAYSRSTGYFCSVAADHPAPAAEWRRDAPELVTTQRAWCVMTN